VKVGIYIAIFYCKRSKTGIILITMDCKQCSVQIKKHRNGRERERERERERIRKGERK
jgi:hypothetical protein